MPGAIDRPREQLTWTWLDEPRAYAGARASPEGFPLLRPTSPSRAARWIDVLRDATPAPPAASARDWVIAIGNDARAPGQLLARMRGRRFATAPGLPAVRGALGGASPASLVLVGAPSRFGERQLQRFAASVDVPWGVVTAADAPGLAFMVAKLCTAPPRTGEVALVDAIDEQVAVLDAQGFVTRRRPLSAHEVAATIARPRAVLGLVAHGEGAHAKLASVMLCGLVEGLAAASAADCGIDGDHRRCRRVWDDRTTVIPFHAIGARAVLLLSCNSFSVAGELFPSAVSAVLALADGATRAILATRSPIPASPELAHALAALCCGGARWGEVARTANEIWARGGGGMPFVVFGDPLERAMPSPGPRAQGAARIDATDRSRQRVIAARTPDGGAVFRTRRGLVLARQRRAATTAFAFEPAGARLHARRARARWLAGRLHRARQLVAAAWQFLPDLAPELRLPERLTELSEAEAQLERLARAELRMIAEIERTGVWLARHDARPRSIPDTVALWDRGFALLVRDVLFHTDYDQICASGMASAAPAPAPACVRCRASRVRTRARDPHGHLEDQVRIDCPVCGFQEAHGRHAPRLVVTAPTALRPGRWRFRAALHPAPGAPPPPPGLPPSAWIAAELKDKGRGERLLSYAAPVAGPTTITADVPATLSPEVHTLDVAWVSCLDVVFARLRCVRITAP